MERKAIFDRIRREIKESSDYLIIGIDVSKDKHNACFMVSDGRLLNKSYQFANITQSLAIERSR